MAETVKGLNIKLSLDGRDLENELKEIQSDLKEQQKDLKAINANLKYDSSNVELWKNTQSKLNEILQTTKKKLEKGKNIKEEDFSLVIDTIFRIIYVLHRPFSKTSYNDFLMSLDFSILSDSDELQVLSQTIGDMLGTLQKSAKPSPQSK